jgi:hypothetical protein
VSLRFTLHDSSKKKSDGAVKPVWFGSSPSCEKELPRRSRVFTIRASKRSPKSKSISRQSWSWQSFLAILLIKEACNRNSMTQFRLQLRLLKAPYNTTKLTSEDPDLAKITINMEAPFCKRLAPHRGLPRSLPRSLP